MNKLKICTVCDEKMKGGKFNLLVDPEDDFTGPLLADVPSLETQSVSVYHINAPN